MDNELIIEKLDEEMIKDAIRQYLMNRPYVIIEGRTPGRVELNYDRKSQEFSASCEVMRKPLPTGLSVDLDPIDDVIALEAGTPRNDYEDLDLLDFEVDGLFEEEDTDDED